MMAASQMNPAIKINYPGSGNNSQFSYDTYGHIVSIVETSADSVIKTKNFVWSVMEMCESRDATGGVTAAYFGLGQIYAGNSYFYSKDHLSSNREISDAAGTVLNIYDYSPFGQTTRKKGSDDPDYLYASYYFHGRSGLHFPVHRSYSSQLGRWLNRDPKEESGGVNLYAYVHQRPTLSTDPMGLAEGPWNVINPGIAELLASRNVPQNQQGCMKNFLKHALASASLANGGAGYSGSFLGGVYIELLELGQNYTGTVSNGVGVVYGTNTPQQQYDYAKFSHQLNESLSGDTLNDLQADIAGIVAADQFAGNLQALINNLFNQALAKCKPDDNNSKSCQF